MLSVIKINSIELHLVCLLDFGRRGKEVHVLWLENLVFVYLLPDLGQRDFHSIHHKHLFESWVLLQLVFLALFRRESIVTFLTCCCWRFGAICRFGLS